MKARNSHIAAALAAILAGALAGYLAGEITRPNPRVMASKALPGEGKTAAPLARPAPRIFEPAPLPEATFTDARQLDAFVAELVHDGFSEKHALWVALRMRSGQDMATSLALARERKALDLWAAGAAEIDPTRAFALLQGLGDRERSEAQTAFFSALGRLDPRAGLGFLGQLNPASGFNARTAIDFFRNWAAVAPFDTVAGAVKDLPPGARRMAMVGLFKAWRETDREGMLEWAAAQGPSEAKMAFRALYDADAIRNPEELFELATQFPTAADWLTLAVATEQLAVNGADGFRAIAELPPGPMRTSSISRFASDFAQRDPEGAWDFMATLPPKDQAQFFESAVRYLSKIKPREVAEKLKSGEFGMGDFPPLMEEWARKDPLQALDWSQRNLAGSTQLESIDKVFSSWSEKSPAEAAAALRGLPAGLRASALPSVAASFGAADPRAALAWAGQLPAVERTSASNGAIRGWAAKDPAAAAQALAGMPPEGMNEAFETVGRQFAQSDPAAATQWAAALPDEKRRNDAIGNIIDTWAGQNAASASEYLADLAPGDFRDRAVAGFVSAVRGLDPASAASWANSIGVQGMRENQVRIVLQSWKAKDREGARAFVNALKPSPWKEQMRQLVEK
jgi:hypothetical protein